MLQRIETPVTVTLYTDTSAFHQLRDEWNALVLKSHLNTVFSMWEWHRTWWEAYQPGNLYLVTCRDNAGLLLGIGSWYIKKHPEHGRILEGVGCVDVTDYLDIIADKSAVELVYGALADFLVAHRDDYDLIDLCSIPQDSPTHTLFTAALQQRGFSVNVAQQDVCPIIALPATWDEYLNTLNKKQRHELRRKLRRAEGVDEKVSWFIVADDANLDDEITHFFRLMAASDPQKQRFLENERHVTFFRNIMPIMRERGWLEMSFLTIDGERAAGYINFVYGERVMVYNSGLDHQTFGQFSPGIVLLAYNIQYAIERGYRYFDFLRGDEEYKYRLGGQDSSVFQLEARLS